MRTGKPAQYLGRPPSEEKSAKKKRKGKDVTGREQRTRQKENAVVLLEVTTRSSRTPSAPVVGSIITYLESSQAGWRHGHSAQPIDPARTARRRHLFTLRPRLEQGASSPSRPPFSVAYFHFSVAQPSLSTCARGLLRYECGDGRVSSAVVEHAPRASARPVCLGMSLAFRLKQVTACSLQTMETEYNLGKRNVLLEARRLSAVSAKVDLVFPAP
ncbi:hypothetical protein HPB51_001734 [Rhipicephalus microplus]|uniref:Uncharacterized protein n=1 Tax=Rhipicephalus microplus TaxID=6941 RepID=A0A9J6DE93_RHIMP|nr:hypothetical protein HPB51_001734 [Rhipicephalus microplus]